MRRQKYRLVTEHIPGSGEKGDAGENVHIVLRKGGKGRDKSGELWDKWDVVAKFSTKDQSKIGGAREDAWRAYKRARGDWK